MASAYFIEIGHTKVKILSILSDVIISSVINLEENLVCILPDPFHLFLSPARGACFFWLSKGCHFHDRSDDTKTSTHYIFTGILRTIKWGFLVSAPRTLAMLAWLRDEFLWPEAAPVTILHGDITDKVPHVMTQILLSKYIMLYVTSIIFYILFCVYFYCCMNAPFHKRMFE